MPRRGTAEERRAQIRQAAAAAFAVAGLHGTSVELIAREIGISEAYVFRLFGTKRALFLDVVTTAFDAVTSGMVAAAGDATGVNALMRMGEEYKRLLADRQRLMLQMQGFAACGDPTVRDSVRAAFGRLWNRVAEISGLDPPQVKTFIAFGMLLNDMAALDARGLRSPWAKQATAPVPRQLYELGAAEHPAGGPRIPPGDADGQLQ
jgi:AcrR family transcriptional regulator